MTDAEQREAARRFINTWSKKGYEKGDTQRFWLSFLANVLGVEYATEKIEFEKEVVIGGQTKFIDAYITDTKVLIEQKSYGKDLNKAMAQSGGLMMTPYEQAKNYANNLPFDEIPRWIITCNFGQFYIYDMNSPGKEPDVVQLENLQEELYRFRFLINEKNKNVNKEMEISMQAGDIVGELYDELLKQYKDPTNENSLKSLNALCVRLVFCLYAEDAGIFGRHGMFHDYLMRFSVRDLRKALIELFIVLDTKTEDRDPYMDEELAAFPYVNGGLFSDEKIEIPQFTEKVRDLLLKRASEDFNWSEISPTIFGAVFESTLNPETRRSGGMHYTSIENIHKVIDPLFLNEIKEELEEIKKITVAKTKKTRLNEFQEKLASLCWLDPACGSGNFLTESYISIRRIENEVLKLKIEVEKGQVAGQITFGDLGSDINPIKVSIGQFYGIEINDFAVTVAKTALWIAESQMMKETEDVVHMNLDFLPLKSYANIVEGNALRMDWNDVVAKEKLNYIMGNPPFVGYSMQNKEQKNDIANIYVDEKGKTYKTAGKNDYVSCWYYKAAQFILNTSICTAFVSTNSITQGEQVATAWKPLYEQFHIHIDFAYRTFRWDSEANIKAHVHCVIIGFSCMQNMKDKILYDNQKEKIVENINPYLIDAENIFIETRKKPLCDVPNMIKGSSPVDGGNLFISEEESKTIQEQNPNLKKYIKKFYGAREYLHNLNRECLWLEGIKPAEVKSSSLLLEKIQAVKEFRLASTKVATQKYAEYPMRFMEMRQPDNDYILVPRHSSENRRYIPFGFMSKDIICGDANNMIPSATLYHFGIIISNVHMAWTRAVCGRIKSDYRYSNDIVYNNFPWPDITEKAKEMIEKTAQGILDARNIYPESSLADLYNPLTMPIELKKAHQANDRAVMKAYGFNVKEMSEADCVAELMKLYQKRVEEISKK